MSTTVFVYKTAWEVVEIDTEYDLNIDSAAAGTDRQHLEAAAALRHRRDQDQACDNRQDSWEELILGLLHASSVQSTAGLHFWIQHRQF